MIVERIWTGNAWRNFNYLVACGETGEALAVDPLDWQLCLRTARDRGWTITQILNTHEHHDHTGGNEGLRAATGAKVLAHAGAAGRIGGVDRGLARGDVIRVGRSAELECLDTPGHTMAHVCLLAHAPQPALFCGDTLFNAGAGNVHNGGNVGDLYTTFAQQLATLPDNTRVYAGHDYIENNLKFTLNREPDNQAAKAMLELETVNIQEVASNVGYEDVSFFRSVFKRATGMTPGEYREKFAKFIVRQPDSVNLDRA